MSAAIFQNADQALRFAFNSGSRGAQRPYLNRLAAPSLAGEPTLAGIDGAAQAGMIRAEVAALGKTLERVLKGRFAPRSLPCNCGRPCCRRSFENPEWIEAVSALAEEIVRRLKLSGSYLGLRTDIVRKYFSGGVKIQDLVKRHGLSRNTVSVFNSRMVRELRQLENRATMEIEDRLMEMDLLPAQS